MKIIDKNGNILDDVDLASGQLVSTQRLVTGPTMGRWHYEMEPGVLAPKKVYDEYPAEAVYETVFLYLPYTEDEMALPSAYANETAITELADYISTLEARISALEGN